VHHFFLGFPNYILSQNKKLTLLTQFYSYSSQFLVSFLFMYIFNHFKSHKFFFPFFVFPCISRIYAYHPFHLCTGANFLSCSPTKFFQFPYFIHLIRFSRNNQQDANL